MLNFASQLELAGALYEQPYMNNRRGLKIFVLAFTVLTPACIHIEFL